MSLRALRGVFGGAFAPFHNGHLRLAIEARDQLELDRVLLMPTPSPPHREVSAISFESRADWVRAAVRDESGLCVDDREARRSGPSYTVDTLLELRKEHPGLTWCLLLGGDSFNTLHRWHHWQQLAQLAHLVVVARPGETLQPDASVAAHFQAAPSSTALRATQAGSWLQLPAPALSISSTAVRALLRQRRSIRGLIPDAILSQLTPQDIEAMTADE